MAFFGEARFPLELRDHIWKFAVEAYPPRIVELTGKHKNTLCTPDGDIVPVEDNFVSNAPIPATLHTCSRSREISKKRWTLTFDLIYEPVNGAAERIENLQSLPKTWFDFEADTLLFMEGASKHHSNINIFHFMKEIHFSIERRIQNIILNFEPDGWEFEPFITGWNEPFSRTLESKGSFPGLRNFSISFTDEDEYLPYDLNNAQTVIEEDTSMVYEEEMVSSFQASFARERGENSVVVKKVGIVRGGS